MSNILLLGAGFSKNWGAPVASEFFTALIADAEVRTNEAVRARLWDSRLTSFEDVLTQFRQESKQSPSRGLEKFLLLQGAISRIFARINALFRRQQFELVQDRLTQDPTRTVREFLTRFDAIFTLNQDLLLEIHYFNQPQGMMVSRWNRWNGVSIPGMQAIGKIADTNDPLSSRDWITSGDLKVPARRQPFYKLHGSTNWKAADGSGELMILGGGKRGAIGQNPVLDHYHKVFAETLRSRGARLTVIGYGFRDEHINEVLSDAVVNDGLQFYVVDPRGAGLAYDARPLKEHHIGFGPTDFEAWFQKGLYSASTTPVRRLLLDDSVDREVLEDFLTER